MSFFQYDELVQESFRYVIKKILNHVSEHGLPGDHHFYITYRTDYPGVDLPEYILERHPEEITIVLQHQFWGLKVHESYFQVSLSFNNIQETLKIPYGALISFFDPSVKFGLQFAPDEDYDEMDMEFEDEEEEGDDYPPLSPTPHKKSKKGSSVTEKKGEENNILVLDHFRKK